MNRFFKLSVIIFSMFMATVSAYAEDGSSYEVSMDQESEPIYVKDPERGHRMPSKRINCTITTNGIYFSSMNVEEIISFEVYDRHGVCIASFIDEQDFLSFLFSTSGAVKIIFRTDGYLLRGFIDR